MQTDLTVEAGMVIILTLLEKEMRLFKFGACGVTLR